MTTATDPRPPAPPAQIIGPAGKVLNAPLTVDVARLAEFRQTLVATMGMGVAKAYELLPNDVTGYERMAIVIGVLKSAEGVVGDDAAVNVQRQRLVLALLEYLGTIEQVVPRYATLMAPGLQSRPVTPETAQGIYKEPAALPPANDAPVEQPTVSAVDAVTSGLGSIWPFSR